MLRATRATRERPRPDSGRRSTARSRSSDAAAARRGAAASRRACAVSTLSSTLADASPAGTESSAARARGTVTTRSNRSRRACDSLARNEARRCAEHEHSAARVAASSARAEIHRRHQLEARGKDRLASDARNRHDAVLERLPQGFEHRPLELGQLVEQQARPDGRGSPRRDADLRRRRRPQRLTRSDAAHETAGARRTARLRTVSRPLSGCA